MAGRDSAGLWPACLLVIAVTGVAVRSAGSQEPSRTVWDGVFTAEQAKHGEEIYRKECAMCHGSQLTGGETAPPLTGGEFLSNWNGLSVGDLVERIRKTMPSSKPGKLSRKDNTDVTAFMFSVNEFPAGETELSEKLEFQKLIRIDSQRPERKAK